MTDVHTTLTLEGEMIQSGVLHHIERAEAGERIVAVRRL